jgi:hypothetical protein
VVRNPRVLCNPALELARSHHEVANRVDLAPVRGLFLDDFQVLTNRFVEATLAQETLGLPERRIAVGKLSSKRPVVRCLAREPSLPVPADGPCRGGGTRASAGSTTLVGRGVLVLQTFHSLSPRRGRLRRSLGCMGPPAIRVGCRGGSPPRLQLRHRRFSIGMASMPAAAGFVWATAAALSAERSARHSNT